MSAKTMGVSIPVYPNAGMIIETNIACRIGEKGTLIVHARSKTPRSYLKNR